MTTEEKRLIIAEALAQKHVNRDWRFSPDHSVPEMSFLYAVYDGLEIIGGGKSLDRVPALVARAAMPIVFYLPAKSTEPK